MISSVATASVMEVSSSGNPIGQKAVSRDKLERFRSTYRVGVGGRVGGAVGVAGSVVELNINPRTSVTVGGGGGPGYGSFLFDIKNILGGYLFTPYFSIGYARWFNHGDTIDAASLQPQVLGRNWITAKQINEGSFIFDFITPSVGVQYQQMSGPWAGFAVGLDAVMLLNIQRLASLPVASMNMLYYF